MLIRMCYVTKTISGNKGVLSLQADKYEFVVLHPASPRTSASNFRMHQHRLLQPPVTQLGFIPKWRHEVDGKGVMSTHFITRSPGFGSRPNEVSFITINHMSSFHRRIHFLSDLSDFYELQTFKLKYYVISFICFILTDNVLFKF